MGSAATHLVLDESAISDAGEAPDVRLDVLYTKSKLIHDTFAQLAGVTSGTSFGSAKVMSTHYYFC